MKTVAVKPFALLILVICFLSGCVSSTNQFQKIKTKDVPIELTGFSVLPPKGDNWEYRIPDNFSVEFDKKGDDFKTYGATLSITPSPVHFNDPELFKKHIISKIHEDTDKNRFINFSLSSNLSSRYNSTCVQYIYSATDITASEKTGADLTIKAYGYSFVHPDSKSFIVSVVYHERAQAGRISENFSELGESFANGCRPINFNPDDLIELYYPLSQNLKTDYASKTIAEEALEKYRKNGDEIGQAEAYHALANYYRFFSREPSHNSEKYLDSALLNFKKSHEFFEKNNNHIGVAKSQYGIGTIYHIKKSNRLACTYYKKSLSTYKKAKAIDKNAEMPMLVEGYTFEEWVNDLKKQIDCD